MSVTDNEVQQAKCFASAVEHLNRAISRAMVAMLEVGSALDCVTEAFKSPALYFTEPEMVLRIRDAHNELRHFHEGTSFSTFNGAIHEDVLQPLKSLAQQAKAVQREGRGRSLFSSVWGRSKLCSQGAQTGRDGYIGQNGTITAIGHGYKRLRERCGSELPQVLQCYLSHSAQFTEDLMIALRNASRVAEDDYQSIPAPPTIAAFRPQQHIGEENPLLPRRTLPSVTRMDRDEPPLPLYAPTAYQFIF
ncbi:hypothetical protein DQ04_05021070 [Trypanosoma grayi]|uniref:hypothetical protein n=1 Tax=Trypanosoma grayi TaxID=71804 RepID=UPI0004F485CE|nr:hypothetical protein DQ04_05021070 [Trypanosoma grayi]KEG09568.1 hypothetical protein DQ04_05021070 [Trypanosoma grayi]